MERRDVLKDQIEQLGRALGNIISNFFQLKAKGKTAQAIEITNEQFKTQLDIDINFILEKELNEVEVYFKERKISAHHIEELVEYIVAIAESKQEKFPNVAIDHYERALALYAMATRLSKIYPMARSGKEQHINEQLKKLYK